MTEQQLKQNISNNLSYYRKRLGLTQSQLADKLSYTDKSISKWERAEGIPDVVVLIKLSELFGITVDELIGNDPPPIRQTPGKKHFIITLLSIGLAWLVAATVYFVLGICLPQSDKLYLCFLVALPASAIVAVVLCALWWNKLAQGLSVTVLIWTLAITLDAAIPLPKMTYVYIIASVLQVLCVLWFFLLKVKKQG